MDDKKLWTLITSPTFFCFELVHCNEIVGLLLQCEEPTPETTCNTGICTQVHMIFGGVYSSLGLSACALLTAHQRDEPLQKKTKSIYRI